MIKAALFSSKTEFSLNIFSSWLIALVKYVLSSIEEVESWDGRISDLLEFQLIFRTVKGAKNKRKLRKNEKFVIKSHQ